MAYCALYCSRVLWPLKALPDGWRRMREDSGGRRQRAVMATDAEWERIAAASVVPASVAVSTEPSATKQTVASPTREGKPDPGQDRLL